jgi:hypothetical protein
MASALAGKFRHDAAAITTDDDIMMRGKVVLRGTLPLCPLERCGGATNRKLGVDDDDEAGDA